MSNNKRSTRRRFSLSGPVIWLVLLAGAGGLAFTNGVRLSMGLYLSSLSTATRLSISDISLAFAFAQLCWGLTQPFAGAVADRIGTGRVIFAAIILVVTGTVLTPYMRSTSGLIFTMAVMAAGGCGMAGPSVMMASSARLLPASKRGMATGIVNAGGSTGQVVMAPLAIWMTAAYGWVTSMQWLGVLVLLALPAAWILKGNARNLTVTTEMDSTRDELTTIQALIVAFKTPGYYLVAAGFMVCGFHVAFLVTHMPGIIAMCGMSPSIGGWSLALIGLFNIVGSLFMGWAVGRWRMKSLLVLLYSIRGLAVVIFVLSPMTPTVVLIFSAIMGVTFLSTVPPTIGLVAKMFGPKNLAMLFGVLMMLHQIGGFFGAYMGGRVVQLTGSYSWMWYLDIALAVAAALMNLPVHEPRLAPYMKMAGK